MTTVPTSPHPFGTLALSSMTAPGSTLRDRVEAAARAGFTGVGLRPGDLRRAMATGLGPGDVRSILHGNGIAVTEIDVLVGWGLDGSDLAEAGVQERRMHELADELGAHHMTVTGQLTGPWERGVELFAGVCERAAAHGLAVALEFLPWTEVPDAATAHRLIRDAGPANAGVLVDAWHHFRGAADDTQLLALPADLLIAVQIDDGALTGSGSLYEQTFDRLLPGEGEFDLTHFLRLLAGHGVPVPLCVEVISPRMAAIPVAEAARLAADATRAVLRRAFPAP